MARGGTRPGAGRKKGSTGTKPGPGKPPKHKVYASPIREAEGKIRDRLPEIVDEAIRQALEDHSETQTRYLIDRIMGKPVQPISLVDTVRAMALREGLSDEETEAAVAEAEQIMKAPARARS